MGATPACQFSTVRSDAVHLRRHVLPVLGRTPLDAVPRADCRRLMAACRAKGLSPKTVEHICRTVSSILSHAVEDGHLSANDNRSLEVRATGLRKHLFNDAMHALRDRVERTFAWEDKFKRLLLWFEHIQQRHYGMKRMAYILINVRRFCTT